MKLADLLNRCRTEGTVLTTAESCTGGMVSCWITDIPGSSDVFDRGFVTYSNAAKHEMLGVRTETLDTFGAVSEEVAQEMAKGALDQSNATLAVAITGIAGPGGSEHKPEGRVCFACGTATDMTYETVEFGVLGRDRVRRSAARHALSMIQAALEKAAQE